MYLGQVTINKISNPFNAANDSARLKVPIDVSTNWKASFTGKIIAIHNSTTVYVVKDVANGPGSYDCVICHMDELTFTAAIS
jgi:hypothetical protein